MTALRTLERGRKLVAVPFLLIGVLFLVGLFFVSTAVLDFLLAEGEVGEALLLHGVSWVLTSLFFLLVTSSTITASSTLFRQDETRWLFAQPLPTLAIFFYKSLESAFYSLWILLILTVPIFAALFVSYSGGLLVVPLTIVALLSMTVIACGLGVLLAFGFVWLTTLRRTLPKWIIPLTLLGIAYFLTRGQAQESSLLPDLSSFTAIRFYLRDLQSTSPLLPGSWVGSVYVALGKGQWREGLYWLGVLLANLAMVGQLLYLAGKNTYLNLWWRSESRSGSQYSILKAHLQKIPFWKRELAVVEKDIKLFVRDPRQWTQTLFVFGVFLVFLLILRQVPARFEIFDSVYATMMSYLAFAVTGYFFTVFALRFVLPTMSLEGSAFWVLLAAPLSRSALLRMKLWPLLMLLLVAAWGLTSLLGNWLSMPEPVATLLLVSSLSAIAVITLFTFAAGVFGINLRERDPSKLSSSLGSVVTTMIIFGYLLLMIVILAYPLDQFFKARLERQDFDQMIIVWTGGGVVFLALVLAILLWQAARIRFARQDF